MVTEADISTDLAEAIINIEGLEMTLEWHNTDNDFCKGCRNISYYN